MKPQDQSGQQERKDLGAGSQKQPRADRPSGDRPSTQPQNPADLGFDPKPDNVQASGQGTKS